MAGVPTGDGLPALLLGIAALVISAIVPIVVALVNRGGKAKPVELDPTIVVPRLEWDRMRTITEDLDDELARKDHEIRELHREISTWTGRAYSAGWREHE